MKAPIVVLGADSYLGRHLLAALAKTDWAAAVPIATANRRELQQHLSGAHAVISCISQDPASISEGAAELFDLLPRIERMPRVVHISSMTVYGSAIGVVDEDAGLLADLGPYSRAHAHAEQLAGRYANSVILRPGAEYGPDCPHWSGRVARLLQAHRLGDLGVSGDGIANVLFIEDFVTLVLAALSSTELRGQVFNLAQAVKPTWNEYFTLFAEALGAVPVRRISQRQLTIETRVLALPLKACELAANKLRIATGLLPPAIPRSLLRLCSQEINLNVAKAQTLLGAHWTSLGEGLKRAAEYYHRT